MYQVNKIIDNNRMILDIDLIITFFANIKLLIKMTLGQGFGKKAGKICVWEMYSKLLMGGTN